MVAEPGVRDMIAMYSEDLPLNISGKDLQQTLDILVPQVVEKILEVIKVKVRSSSKSAFLRASLIRLSMCPVPRAWQPRWRLRSQARTVARM